MTLALPAISRAGSIRPNTVERQLVAACLATWPQKPTWVLMIVASAMPESSLKLAEFERNLNNSEAVAKLYEHAVRGGDDVPLAQHAYGLHLVRSGRSSEAVQYLRRAVELDGTAPRFVFVYAVALNSIGKQSDAIDTLRAARARFPDHFDIGWALATIYRDAGDRSSAREIARQLSSADPDDERPSQLLDALQDQPAKFHLRRCHRPSAIGQYRTGPGAGIVDSTDAG